MPEEQMSSARRTYMNMKRIVPALKQKGDEKDSAYRLRMEAYFCERWNCSVSMFRKCTSPTFPPERSFDKQKNPRFFEDMKKYGGAKWTAQGLLVQKSLGHGPDFESYASEVYNYRALRAAQRAEP